MPYKPPSLKGLDKWTPEPDTGYRLSMTIMGENNMDVQCPYCLHIGKRYQFFSYGKNGKPKGRTFECPDCHVEMQWQTLNDTLDMNIKDYAEWVYSVRPFDPGRLKWAKIKERLRQQNLTGQFWDAYFAKKHTYMAEHPQYSDEQAKKIPDEQMKSWTEGYDPECQ